MRERLRSFDLVGSSITTVVDLLQRWIAPLNGEGVAMLLAVVLDICNCRFLRRKFSGRES